MRASSRKLLIAATALGALGFVAYRAVSFISAIFAAQKLLHTLRDAHLFLLAISVIAIYGCYALRALRSKVSRRNLGSSHFM